MRNLLLRAFGRVLESHENLTDSGSMSATGFQLDGGHVASTQVNP
jgi:hypothetical protein